jgi:uncharacterized membrane protein
MEVVAPELAFWGNALELSPMTAAAAKVGQQAQTLGLTKAKLL